MKISCGCVAGFCSAGSLGSWGDNVRSLGVSAHNWQPAAVAGRVLLLPPSTAAAAALPTVAYPPPPTPTPALGRPAPPPPSPVFRGGQFGQERSRQQPIGCTAVFFPDALTFTQQRLQQQSTQQQLHSNKIRLVVSWILVQTGSNLMWSKEQKFYLKHLTYNASSIYVDLDELFTRAVAIAGSGQGYVLNNTIAQVALGL